MIGENRGHSRTYCPIPMLFLRLSRDSFSYPFFRTQLSNPRIALVDATFTCQSSL